MKTEDLEFLAEIIEKSHWLMYGDLDEHIDGYLVDVFQHELREYGFEEIKLPRDSAIAYWFLVSELVALNLVEYGTSPRGAWFTPEGERFKKLVLEHQNAIEQANEYIYKKYND